MVKIKTDQNRLGDVQSQTGTANKCFRCLKLGHFSSQCERPNRSKMCLNCDGKAIRLGNARTSRRIVILVYVKNAINTAPWGRMTILQWWKLTGIPVYPARRQVYA